MQSCQEKLVLTQKEMDRLGIIGCVIKRKLTWREAALQLRLSCRQIGRLACRVRQEGNQGIIHHLRGRPSNHKLKEGLLDKALKTVRDKYWDFGPTFAVEKLEENHKIILSKETLRQGMIKAGLRQARKRKPFHRSWRPRRTCLGELVQLDGSHHDWFEGRAPKCVLVAFIDDATSQILHGEFTSSENALELFMATKNYLTQWGRPLALYADKHGIFHVNRQAVVEEHLRDPYPTTQYTRAMAELGIEVIPAHSPQAKGRVERLFETLQDRLVKEMRLRNICSMNQGNEFLWKEYLPSHNLRFSVPATNPLNVHRSLDPNAPLEEILCFQTERVMMNDWTVRFKNQFLQILKDQPVEIRPKDRVLVESRLDGSIHLKHKGYSLNFKPITKPYWQLGRQEIAVCRNYPAPIAPPITYPSLLKPSQRVTWYFEQLKIQQGGR